MANDSRIRKQIADMLQGAHAHASFEQVIDSFPADKVGIRPEGLPHSGWEILEHLRIAQSDILKFSESADHTSPKWPDEYWPNSPAPANADEWQKSVRSFYEDLAAFEHLLHDDSRDLTEPFSWGEGQNLLREAILIIDHNAYHLGEMVMVRRALGEWGK